MAEFLFHELNKEICLTCQHFRQCPRKVKVVGRQMFIAYEKTMGACGLFNNFPTIITTKANFVHYCHYKRWVDLP